MISSFLNSVGKTLRIKGYSYKTEQTYLYWIKFYIRFHNLTHPKHLGPTHVKAFLEFLTLNRKVPASTQSLALNAIVFVYRHVLKIELGNIAEYQKSNKLKQWWCRVKSTRRQRSFDTQRFGVSIATSC